MYGQFVRFVVSFCVSVYFLLFVFGLVVTISSGDCLERLVSEMTYYVTSRSAT